MSYISNRDGVVRTGPHVDDLLTKIEDLEDATSLKSGTMSAKDKIKLDGLNNISIDELSEILV
jgi:hypothetical protein